MQELNEDAAATWTSRHIVRAGGLIGVGFADNTDLLLIATHDGLSVVNCSSGELLARDPDPLFPFDEQSRKAQGIGPLAGKDVLIAGDIYGGDLPQITDDGWKLTGSLTNSSDDVLQLTPPISGAAEPHMFTGFVPEIRVFGFSPTGRSFVIGTGAEVFIFAR